MAHEEFFASTIRRVRPRLRDRPLALGSGLPASDAWRSAAGGGVHLISELEGWHRGIAPPSVRRAVDHEIRRRGMLRVDLARRLGVSKQQLTNVLHGRFGASPALANGFAAFIRDGAQSTTRGGKRDGPGREPLDAEPLARHDWSRRQTYAAFAASTSRQGYENRGWAGHRADPG